jgi:hypothetical protein
MSTADDIGRDPLGDGEPSEVELEDSDLDVDVLDLELFGEDGGEEDEGADATGDELARGYVDPE